MVRRQDAKADKSKDQFATRDWSKKTERIIVGIFIVIAFIIRSQIIEYHSFVSWDGTNYVNYFRDADWQHVFPPGYPIFIELFRFFISDGVLAAQWVSIVFSCLLIIPLFYLARHFLSSHLALLVTVLASFNPLMLRNGVVSLSEMQYIFFVISAFYFYYKKLPLWFGLSCGLAYLTRPEALVFIGIICLY